LTTHFNIINRWKYKGENKEGQIGVKFLHDDRHGGQMSFDFSNPGTTTAYGSDMRTQRLEFFSKGGLALNSSSSVGLIFSAFRHKLDSFWGRKNYAGDESSLFTNLLFETTVRRHSFSSGLSYTLTARDETYMRTLYETNESVPGAFIEYTWRMNDRLTAMLGWRYDWHNLYGAFSTPRMHLKYDEGTTSLRLSLGKGYRVPHIFMDNPAILTSSRELLVSQPLRTEEAWNAGLQIVKDFRIAADRPASLSLDFYRTVFVQQVVVDMEQHPQQIWLYNLNGRSFSNSAQIELNLSAARGLDLTSAYRFNDVRTTYQQWLQKVPLTAAHKGLFVISYTLPADTWQFDITTQFNGKSRLPNGHMNPEFQREAYSPSYILLFTQVTRKFAKWELYAGVENITDYRQPNPVLGWNDPFGPTFDSSILWGPTIGRRLYVGIRTN
ncbi:TonB-dependent receptor, partial [candidate division KSB1 bacterium]|nr:TonB-dependent receptor [candidate division KSB1 bacterium]